MSRPGPSPGPGLPGPAGWVVMVDAFWRAAAYCLHPRVLLSALGPLLLAGAALGLAGWAFWEDAVAAVRAALDRWELAAALLQWLAAVGLPQLRSLAAPLVVVALVTPAVAVLTLWLVAVAMAPALARLVTLRRFAGLALRGDRARWRVVLAALVLSALALTGLVATAWAWLLPPLALLLPPLVLGWLVARVLAPAALAAHASGDEQATLRHRERGPLMLMGATTGALALLPAGLWTLGAVVFIFAPVLMVLATWLYLGVFTFAALWHTHFLLARLHALRQAEPAVAAVVADGSGPSVDPSSPVPTAVPLTGPAAAPSQATLAPHP